MKVCSKCKMEKDESGFYKDRYRPDGLKCNCKSCENNQVRVNQTLATVGRICSRCKIDKDIRQFYTDKKGLHSWCKSCLAFSHKKYREGHKEQIEAGRKKWTSKNEGKVKVTSRKYYEANKDKVIESAKLWKDNNRAKHGSICKKWKKENRKKYLESERKRAKRKIIDLSDSYVKQVLKLNGYSTPDIAKLPILIEIKKIQIINHRVKRNKI